MNRGIKGLIIVGSIFVGVGLTVSLVGLATSGFKWTGFGNYKVEEKTYDVESPVFENINIQEVVGNLTFVATTDGTCKVECNELEKVSHTVEIKDNTLYVTAKDSRKFYEKWGFGFNYSGVTTTIYLPITSIETATISNDTGSITMGEEFSFTTATVDNDTGSINWNANVSQSIKLSNDTGTVTIEKGTYGSLDASTATGSLKISNASIASQIITKTSTGSTYLTDVTGASLNAKCSTGSLHIKKTTVTGDFNLETNTGSINFDQADATNIYAETDTGSIKGTLLTSKQFDAKSDTGSVHVPESDSTKGVCRLRTDTGSINITIA